MEMTIKNLCVSIGRKEIVKDVSLSVPEGRLAILLGPNGSGKSTMLKAVYRTLPYQRGQILLDGQDASRMTNREFSTKVAVVSQFSTISFDFTVMEIVLMGRTPHLGMLSKESQRDRELAQNALRLVGMDEFSQRHFDTLSGGEKQRVLLARAITQEPMVLILDEPTNHLDIYYQLQVLSLVKRLGISCIAALHDLALAAQFGDLIYLLKAGSLVTQGAPEEVLTPEAIYDVYGVKSHVTHLPETGSLTISCLPP